MGAFLLLARRLAGLVAFGGVTAAAATLGRAEMQKLYSRPVQGRRARSRPAGLADLPAKLQRRRARGLRLRIRWISSPFPAFPARRSTCWWRCGPTALLECARAVAARTRVRRRARPGPTLRFRETIRRPVAQPVHQDRAPRPPRLEEPRGRGGGNRRRLQGARASVRIINETIVNSALQVARERLGFSKGRDPDRVARIRPNLFAPLTFAQMLDRGYIRHLWLTNAEAEQAFGGTGAEGLDKEVSGDPSGVFADLYIAQVDVPIIGQPARRKQLAQADGPTRRRAGDDGDFFRALDFYARKFRAWATPDLIGLAQSGAPVAWRDFVWRDQLDLPTPGLDLSHADVAMLRIAPEAAFDPATSLAIFTARDPREGDRPPRKIRARFQAGLQRCRNTCSTCRRKTGTGDSLDLGQPGARHFHPERRLDGAHLRAFASKDAGPLPPCAKSFPARLSRVHACFHRLDRAGATLHRLAVRADQGGPGRGHIPVSSCGTRRH